MTACYSGGCACGAVRFDILSEPKRTGLCHCLTCRKAHASAFNAFTVFAAKDVSVKGPISSWFSSPGYDRRFCEICGSRVLALNGDEVEISIGSLDRVATLQPQYESWVCRREDWLRPLDVPQHLHDRR